ncbi:MAG: glycosyltransferase family 9 protein [Pirellulales bacterium]|nr:glycosyltransferase family 9 protein [Pirellulales bacterium]
MTSPRILIVRLSAIGDTVLSIPVLCALRDHFPHATIGWIVERTSAPMLRGHADLNHLIEVPRGWLKSPRVVWNTVRRLRSIGFDVTLDLQGLTKSSITARLSGARRRLGFTKSDFEGREFSTWINNELVAPTAEHVVERSLELLQPLGIHRPAANFRMPVYEESEAAVVRFIVERGIGAGYAVINTGAGWPSKLWPPERYAAVAAYLGKTRCVPTVVLWSGQQERLVADQIVARAGGYAHLAPQTSLTEVACLARRARLFIGSDTGPLHIAVAVGTPSIGLYGPMPASRCGPYGPKHIALQNAKLPGKLKNRRTADNTTMLAIGVDEVCRAGDDILARPGSSPVIPAPHFRSSVRAK